jgi:D-inositol-3-phosphate glycosyltransferase
MTKHRRLLILGPVSTPYGYARVINSVARFLVGRYEVHQFGLDVRDAVAGAPWPIHPNTLAGDPYGLDQLPALIESVRPNLLWIVNDMWLYLVHKQSLTKYADDLKIVLYCPIDGTDINPGSVRALRSLSRLVVFTEFARAQISAAVAQLKSCPQPFPPVDVVPHGVDVDTFHPCAGNIRKRIDLTIQGFSIFARDKPEHVKLYLHTSMKQLGSNLWPLVHECGVAERLVLTTHKSETPLVPDRHLNLIYNACDVGLNTSTGEGWGLVAFEHAATGAAQILPRHSACEELWNEAGLLVDANPAPRRRLDLTARCVVTPEGVAAALERLYDTPIFRAECAAACYANATRAPYRWNRIAARWDTLLADTLSSDP